MLQTVAFKYLSQCTLQWLSFPCWGDSFPCCSHCHSFAAVTVIPLLQWLSFPCCGNSFPCCSDSFPCYSDCHSLLRWLIPLLQQLSFPCCGDSFPCCSNCYYHEIWHNYLYLAAAIYQHCHSLEICKDCYSLKCAWTMPILSSPEICQYCHPLKYSNIVIRKRLWWKKTLK